MKGRIARYSADGVIRACDTDITLGTTTARAWSADYLGPEYVVQLKSEDGGQYLLTMDEAMAKSVARNLNSAFRQSKEDRREMAIEQADNS